MSSGEKSSGPHDRSGTIRELETVRVDETGEVDLEQFEHQMSLTLEERLRANERMVRFAELIRLGGEEYAIRLVRNSPKTS